MGDGPIDPLVVLTSVAAPPSAPARAPGAVEARGSVVALVYRDGHSLALAASDPRARAFRTVADHLVSRA